MAPWSQRRRELLRVAVVSALVVYYRPAVEQDLLHNSKAGVLEARVPNLVFAYRAPQPAKRLPYRDLKSSSLRASPERSSAGSAGGSELDVALSSMTQSTVNLAKSLVGAGMLSLPLGVATLSGSPKAVVPAICLVLLFGFLSACGFVFIAEACQRTGETTYAGAWSKAVSSRTAWLPAIACTSKAGIACIAYSMILGDCLSMIVATLGLPPWVVTRSMCTKLLATFVLFPLCSLKSLAPLAKFSVLGVLSNVYICFFVFLRYFDGSYGVGGEFATIAPAAPNFAVYPGTAMSLLKEPSAMVLVSILATAFLAHFNAPLFYEQLQPDPKGEKWTRFLVVSALGFGSAATIFSLVMAGGFLTFGTSSAGLILNSYAAADKLAMVARGAVAVSLITAYPFVFSGLRNQLLALLPSSFKAAATAAPGILTVVLLSVVTLIAIQLTNLGKLAALAGAFFGSFLVYLAPAVMVLGCEFQGLGTQRRRSRGWFSRLMLLGFCVLGPLLAVLGCYQVLK